MAGRVRRADRLSVMQIGIDGFLLLMRLAGITDIAPAVLAVHPNIYREQDQRLVDLAVMPTLINAELVDGTTGAVAPEVRRWLRALQEPDEELAIRVLDGDQILRGVVARHDERHIAVFRHDTLLTVQEFIPEDDSFAATAARPLWAQLGPADPAPLEPVIIPTADQSAIAAEFGPVDGEIPNLGRFQAKLREMGVSADGVLLLQEAALYTGRRSEIVYTAPGENGVRRQSEYAVGVLDTSRGRIVSSVQLTRHGVHTELRPGTPTSFVDALRDLIEGAQKRAHGRP